MSPPRLSGELPPPAPRACFGRDDLIEEIVDLAGNLTPVVLIGVGGIGKTSVALTVLHHDRVKRRFGENRRFIRCDQFPASLTHLLNRLSKVTGAGVENPEDLTSLRPFLSSKEMFIVLDNAESILDPSGVDATEIYNLVEELCQLPSLCLCITSRVSTVPVECETLEVPGLSVNAASRAFYNIYKRDKCSDLVNVILEQLDFHPISITLLATVAQQNKWSTDRLKNEWEKRRTSLLQTRHNKSFAATIELSLTSPMFQELGPDARELLGVIAFFPQGVDEDNLGWLFPTISNGIDILGGFCALSLTYRRNGFVTMLAPLRDFLSLEEPKSSPLICAAKERYFARMSVKLVPHDPGFGEMRWITSEDVNVEHLLNVFTTIDADMDQVWRACAYFLEHLYWHKTRTTLLGPKIEKLPDDHDWKPICLFDLARLFYSVGNFVESGRLLTHTLRLNRERGDELRAAETMWSLADVYRQTGRFKEGIRLAEEGAEIYERFGGTRGQGQCLIELAFLLRFDGQLDAAEKAGSRGLELVGEGGNQYQACQCHRALGDIHRSKLETEKAIQHFEAAISIASSFDWQDELFETHSSLTILFLNEDRFEDGRVQLENAVSCAANNAYNLGVSMFLRSVVLHRQKKFEEARSEVLRAIVALEKLGAVGDVERCKHVFQIIQKSLDDRVASGQMREFLQMVLLPAHIDVCSS